MKKVNPYKVRPTTRSVRRFIRQANVENAKFETDYDAVAAFFRKFRKNEDLKTIYLKVHLVNSIFNTRIRDIYGHAIGIHERVEKMDERLKLGDDSLVNEIARYEASSKKEFRFYSFATKYCHCLQPHRFPIYDQYVADSLVQFKKHFAFAKFSRKKLRTDYTLFKAVLKQFRTAFGLMALSPKEVDRFLWKMGRDAAILKKKKK